MAQVHHAVLRDGTEVAVKVQRPGVRQRIEIDLEVLREIARFAAKHTALGARYGAHPLLTHVKITGVNSTTDETMLPKTSTDVTNWQAIGYTRLKVKNAWQTIADTAFPVE